MDNRLARAYIYYYVIFGSLRLEIVALLLVSLAGDKGTDTKRPHLTTFKSIFRYTQFANTVIELSININSFSSKIGKELFLKCFIRFSFRFIC